MYDWISHTHAHLGGECPHRCIYCSVDHIPFGRPAKYKGELRLIEKEFSVNYGGLSEKYPNGKIIFMEHCNDLFAEDVPIEFINKILEHCQEYPLNTYVFQTKNPARYRHYCFPEKYILGVTIETNRPISNISDAPQPYIRIREMAEQLMKTKFITIEPILDFDVEHFVKWIRTISPDFVNIGADSKGHGLKEPTMEKVQALIDKLTEYGIEIREKSNLDRLR